MRKRRECSSLFIFHYQSFLAENAEGDVLLRSRSRPEFCEILSAWKPYMIAALLWGSRGEKQLTIYGRNGAVFSALSAIHFTVECDVMTMKIE